MKTNGRRLTQKSLDEAAVQGAEPQADVLNGHLRVIPYSEAIAEKVLRLNALITGKFFVKHIERYEPAQLEAFQDALDHRHNVPTVLQLLQEIRGSARYSTSLPPSLGNEYEKG